MGCGVQLRYVVMLCYVMLCFEDFYDFIIISVKSQKTELGFF